MDDFKAPFRLAQSVCFLSAHLCSAAFATVFASSIKSTDSRTYTNPREITSGPVKIEPSCFDSVLGQMFSIPQNNVAHIADAQAVNQHRAGLHRAIKARTVLPKLNHLSNVAYNDILLFYAHSFRQHCMLF